MCGKYLVKLEIQVVVVKFGNGRRQVDRLAVADPRFLRHRRERRDLDLFAGQGFDVHTQNALYLFERQAKACFLQMLVRCPGFEGKVAAAGLC